MLPWDQLWGPDWGTFAGSLVGAGGALLFDYVSNRQREHLDRAEFEQASNKALTVTIGESSRSLQRDVSQDIDAWLDDTRTVVIEQKLGKKLYLDKARKFDCCRAHRTVQIAPRHNNF